MDWATTSQIVSILVGLVIALALVYVAIQLRLSNQMARRSEHGSAVAKMLELNTLLMHDGELARIWRVGMQDRSALTEDEEIRWIELTFAFLKASEALHYQWVHGGLDEPTFRGWEAMIGMYATLPPVMKYRGDRRDFFPPAVHSWIESLAPMHSAGAS